MMTAHDPVLSGRICPYCGKNTEFVDSSTIYGCSYGMIYLCRPCDAYVGVHRGTKKALGRLANSELRFWKKEAHTHFDPIWMRRRMSRQQAYQWLCEKLDIPLERTHIGMFDEETCRLVVYHSKELLNAKN